jgi:hypothetical protein
MTVNLQVEGLDELREKYKDAPKVFTEGLKAATQDSLLVVWENVPAYPDQWGDSLYVRTGTLGRSLGVDVGGKPAGTPDIYTVKEQGSEVIGEFGTRLEYAPYVIGENEQASQMLERDWWTIGVIARKAQNKIEQVFKNLAERLAKWLDANGR